MALLGTAVLRYLGARELERYQVQHAPPAHPPAAGNLNRVAPSPGHAHSDSLPDLPPAYTALDGMTPSTSLQTLPGATPEALHAATEEPGLPPLKRHMRVLGRVLRLKNRGAAGGYNANTRSAPRAPLMLLHKCRCVMLLRRITGVRNEACHVWAAAVRGWVLCMCLAYFSGLVST